MKRLSKIPNGAKSRNVERGNLAEGLVLLRIPSCNGLGRGIEIGQASLVGLDWPLSTVAVAREDHMLVLFENLGRLLYAMQGQGPEIIRTIPLHHYRICWHMCWKGEEYHAKIYYL